MPSFSVYYLHFPIMSDCSLTAGYSPACSTLQLLCHSLSVSPTSSHCFCCLCLTWSPHHSLSLWLHHLHILSQVQLPLLHQFPGEPILSFQILLTVLFFSPLSRYYYFPQLHKLSSASFRQRTEQQQKLHVRHHSVIMSSVTIQN